MSRKTIKKEQRHRGVVLSIQEPWFSLLSTGNKSIEIRVNNETLSTLKQGDMIRFQNNLFGSRSIIKIVKSIKKYKSIEDLIKKEPIEKIMPTIYDKEVAINIISRFINRAISEEFGILAIRF